MIHYYDRTGKVIGLYRWAELHADPKYRVLRTHNEGDYLVSTVWMGIDMDVMNVISDSPHPPLIFESVLFMVPQGDDRWSSLEMRRYHTETEALQGHADFVELTTTMLSVAKEVIDE